jgi:hypothetical protein
MLFLLYLCSGKYEVSSRYPQRFLVKCSSAYSMLLGCWHCSGEDVARAHPLAALQLGATTRSLVLLPSKDITVPFKTQ